MSNKFEIEKKVTNAFLKSLGIRHCKIIKPEKDPPDIIAQIAGNLVGIGVTGIVSNEPQLILEKEFEKIFVRVKEHLIKSGIGNLVIRIEPEKNVKINRDKCVEVIINACLEKIEQIGLNKIELAHCPITGINKIMAFRSDNEGVIVTFNSRINIFGPLRNKKIELVVENKIKKLNKLRQLTPEKQSDIHEYWLLITIEGSFYANYSGVHDDQISIMMKNCYDKIFVYHERENWIVELKTVCNNV